MSAGLEPSADGVVIREFQPDEWAAMRDIRLAALADAPYAFGSTLERERGFPEEAWRDKLRSRTLFGAWLDGRPVGMAGCKRDDDAGISYPAARQLVSMFVRPAMRGRGVADRLVRAVADHVRAAGANTLVLWVTEGNDRARIRYQRLGFRLNGARQPLREDEPDHWEAQMFRHLT